MSDSLQLHELQQARLFPVLHCFPEFAQTHVHWVSDIANHLILCHPLLLPSIFPSIRVFSNELVLHIRWPKYWGFSFSISLSNEYSGLISFRIHWFDLLAVQGTLRSLEHHNSKESILLLALCLLYGPPLISTHDYRNKHSFDYMNLCWQSYVSTFEYAVQVCHNSSSKKQASYNSMAAVTICNDFAAQENKIYHSLHFFLIYKMK